MKDSSGLNLCRLFVGGATIAAEDAEVCNRFLYRYNSNTSYLDTITIKVSFNNFMLSVSKYLLLGLYLSKKFSNGVRGWLC